MDLSAFWKSAQPILAGQVRMYLAAGAAAAIGHGYLRPDSAGAVVEIGAGAVSLAAAAGWQVWTDYVQPIIIDQLEILKAKSHAQAAKLKENGIKPVTVTEIAAQSPTMDVAAVTKAIGTLPPAVQANIAGMTGSGVKGSLTALLAILIPIAMAWPGDASAQGRLKLPIDPLHLNGAAAGQSSQPSAVLKNVMSALAKPFQDLANFIAGDADGAANLATLIPSLQDVNGKACWIKMQEAGAVFKAHPVPLTLQIMTDFESFRLLQMTTNDLCSYAPCTVVFSDTSNLVTAVASAAGGAIASSQVPNLTTLCSRIPQIAPQLPKAVTGLDVTAPAAIPPNTTFTMPSTGNPALGAGPVNPTTAPAVTPPVVAPAPAQP
jgi:hypothetical protein